MSKKPNKLLERMRKNLDTGIKADSKNYRAAAEDLRFSNGDQWDSKEKKRRDNSGRIMLTIDLTNKYIEQITGDIRQNTPSIVVKTTSAQGNPQIASVREGIIRNVQYKSKFEYIVAQASESLIRGGYCAWEVATKYINSHTFDQEPVILPIKNCFSVHLDPNRQQIDGSDAEWGFKLSKISRRRFEKKYPKAKIPDAETLQFDDGISKEIWFDGDNVVIAEYFERTPKPIQLVFLSNGETVELSEAKQAMEQDPQITILDQRDDEEWEVKKYICTASEILEEHEWPGKYIPLVLGIGQTLNIEGEDYVRGKIRASKDAQRLYNYWRTTLAETVALAPKAQWHGTPKQFQGYEKDYAESNDENFPFLFYNPDPTVPNGKPERIAPPPVPVAVFQQAQLAAGDVEATMGMYEASIGAPSNEKSGIAIQRRNAESDTGNFVYIDNLNIAVEHTGRIINDMLPHLIDNERTAVLRQFDGSEKSEPVNTPIAKVIQTIQNNPQAYQGIDVDRLKRELQIFGEEHLYNDMTAGEYEVSISTGPSYTTQRQEAAATMMQFSQASARMSPIDKYFLAKNMDWPGVQEYIDAIKRLLPQGLIPLKPGEKPLPPLPPNPNTVLLIQKEKTEQMKQVSYQAKLKAETAKSGKEMAKNADEIKAIVLSTLKELYQQ